MSERNRLLESIAKTIKDYQVIADPTPDHVGRWIDQFNEGVRIPLLHEVNHVFQKTYLSKMRIEKFLRGLLVHKSIVGDDPCNFWKNVKFLDIQIRGDSQKRMLSLFDKILKEKCDFGIAECGENANRYLYLDDGVFTGNHVFRDLEKWMKINAPPSGAKIYIVSIALHSGGWYYAQKNINEVMDSANKKIDIKWSRAILLEDRKWKTNVSDVLRPTRIPNDERVKQYVSKMTYSPNFRNSGNIGKQKIFSSEKGRDMLEQEFLKEGVRIREENPNLGDSQRPLGHTGLDTLGFGSLVVTFWNCPNTAPLVFWVGNDSWYPLFPRVTNRQTEDRREMEAFLDGDR